MKKEEESRVLRSIRGNGKKRSWSIAFVVIGSMLIFLCVYFEKKENTKALDLTIEGSNGDKLFITKPDYCNSPFYGRTYFSMRGTWVLRQGYVHLSCESPPLIDLLSISQATKREKSEYSIDKDHKLLMNDGHFKTYRYGTKNRDTHEVVTFFGDDGNLVYVQYMISDPSNHLVFRRLDESFELTYGLHHQSGNHIEMLENDKYIIEYAKSISRRLK